MNIKQVCINILASSVVIGLLPQAALAKDDSPSAGSSSSALGSKSGGEVLLSKLIGTDLKTGKGEDLGQIKDVVVNPRNGKIRFAIIEVDSGGGAEALAPIPWQAVNLQAENQYVATIDKDKLKKGPHMSEQQWDKLMQPDYVVEVYRFYGFEPQTEQGGAESPGGSRQGGSQSGTKDQQQ